RSTSPSPATSTWPRRPPPTATCSSCCCGSASAAHLCSWSSRRCCGAGCTGSGSGNASGQGAFEALVPVRKLDAEVLLQPGAIEDRVPGTCRGRRVVGRGDRSDDRLAVDHAEGVGALDDGRGETVPAGLAGRRQVPQAGSRGRSREYPCGDVGDQACRRGCSALVGDHAQLVALACEA